METAAAQPVDNAANAFLGIVHDVAHVGADGGPAELRDDAVQFPHAFLIGGDLRFDVGDVHVRAAGGVPRFGQQCSEIRFSERSAIDEEKIVDDDALFLQRAR